MGAARARGTRDERILQSQALAREHEQRRLDAAAAARRAEDARIAALPKLERAGMLFQGSSRVEASSRVGHLLAAAVVMAATISQRRPGQEAPVKMRQSGGDIGLAKVIVEGRESSIF
jgi:hypothetical protein